MQSIYNSFSTTDADFNPYTSCLSFYLEEFFQNIKIKISINFLSFRESNYYQLEFIQMNVKNPE